VRQPVRQADELLDVDRRLRSSPLLYLATLFAERQRDMSAEDTLAPLFRVEASHPPMLFEETVARRRK
jgi:hypothetical protein